MDAGFVLAALASGALIGLVLGVVGGGGSILAVPLLVYAVGMGPPHAAIGTAAVAVALNALAGLAGHARAGTVKWRCAAVFAVAGMIGAALGAELGKSVDGQRLLLGFGLLMIGIGLSTLRKSKREAAPDVRLTRESAKVLISRLVPIGLGVGLAAGFFGIGGGFLIVPGLMLATRMPMQFAVGTSLIVVTALGLTTAVSYAVSGLVDWPATGLLVVGGAAGSLAGIALARKLAAQKNRLSKAFAAMVSVVGAAIVYVNA